ncbi:MAG: hypothetical protein RLZ81_763 [Pseudomonadota bacterium]
MLLAIIVVGAVMAVSVGAFVIRSQRDGMVYWTAGLALHTVSYLFFSQRELLGELASLSIANALRACAWCAFAEGLCEFYRRAPPRKLIWAPVPVLLVAMVLVRDSLSLRIATVSMIAVAQALLVLWLIWQRRGDTPGRGKYFLMAGVAIAITLLTMRALSTTRGAAAAMVSLTESSPIQAISFLGAMVVLLLLSIGFVLMTKDRADDLNRILATRDELTGLANRRRLNEVLASEWARARRSEEPLALIMIDIDHFKLYNDHYGHQAGDACLRRVAQVIQASAGRAGDLAARYGGEEFLLILTGADAARAQRVAEKVRKSVEAMGLPHVHSPTGKITISVGVAAAMQDSYQDAESMLRAADLALYDAKHGGRNQVQVAHDGWRGDSASVQPPAKLVQLIWRRYYESGHPLIDTKHRALFDNANKVLSAVLEDRQTGDVAGMMDAFIADIAQHFREEEAVLAGVAYPAAAEHAAQHRALLGKAVALAARVRAGTLSPGDLFEYLAHEVVARHILIADREFFHALSA